MESSPTPCSATVEPLLRYNHNHALADRNIGCNSKVLIVAELSANHNQRLEVALDTIDAVAEAGADAIKLQTFTPETITYNSRDPIFLVSGGTAWDGRSLHDLYSEAQTPWEWHEKLFERAADRDLLFFSSPFDFSAVDFLETMEVPAYKVASFEITDTPLIRRMAVTGKPVIISTGIATRSEIEEAISVCREVGNEQIVLLKCTSAYPAQTRDANLRTMVDMHGRFDVAVGLSDHTMNHASALAATALGACMIEKHIILDRSMGGPDAGFSLEPTELAELVKLVRQTESARGVVTYELDESAMRSRRFARSLFVVEDVKAGDVMTERNVRSIRPSGGLEPSLRDSLIGRVFLRDVAAGTPLAISLLQGLDNGRGE